MMTSRAEYRLLLRQDNADLRLREIGHKIGLVSDEEYEKLLSKRQAIEEEIRRLENTAIGGTPAVQAVLEQYGSTPLKSGSTLAELVRRPELDYEKIREIDKKRPDLPFDVRPALIVMQSCKQDNLRFNLKQPSSRSSRTQMLRNSRFT